MKLRKTISKYHSWYLCQINKSSQIILLPIKILDKLGSKNSNFPKAFENNNMHFFLEGERGGGGNGNRVYCGRFQSSHCKL